MNELEGKICGQRNLIAGTTLCDPNSAPCEKPATRMIRVRHRTKPELGTGTLYLCDEHYLVMAPEFLKKS